MYAALISSIIGLLIVILAVGIPYWLTHRHMRPQRDPDELQAYEEATGRSRHVIAAGTPGKSFRREENAAQRWQAAQAEDRIEVARPHESVQPETAQPETAQPEYSEPRGRV